MRCVNINNAQYTVFFTFSIFFSLVTFMMSCWIDPSKCATSATPTTNTFPTHHQVPITEPPSESGGLSFFAVFGFIVSLIYLAHSFYFWGRRIIHYIKWRRATRREIILNEITPARIIVSQGTQTHFANSFSFGPPNPALTPYNNLPEHKKENCKNCKGDPERSRSYHSVEDDQLE